MNHQFAETAMLPSFPTLFEVARHGAASFHLTPQLSQIATIPQGFKVAKRADKGLKGNDSIFRAPVQDVADTPNAPQAHILLIVLVVEPVGLETWN